MPYTLLLSDPLAEKLDNKQEPQRRAIRECFKKLRQNPRYPGLRTKKMQGRGGLVFESRASKGDRVTWFWDGSRIIIENHCKHDIVES